MSARRSRLLAVSCRNGLPCLAVVSGPVRGRQWSIVVATVHPALFEVEAVCHKASRVRATRMDCAWTVAGRVHGLP